MQQQRLRQSPSRCNSVRLFLLFFLLLILAWAVVVNDLSGRPSDLVYDPPSSRPAVVLDNDPSSQPLAREFCVASLDHPKDWHTRLLTEEEYSRYHTENPRYHVTRGRCVTQCHKLCTNSTTYNGDNCAQGQYSQSECCPKYSSHSDLPKEGDKCNSLQYCCPYEYQCLLPDKDVIDFHRGVCRRPFCPSFCTSSGDCCDGEWCDVGLGEVESNNGQCTRLQL